VTQKNILNKAYYPNIDILRGIAILSVIIVHCSLNTGISTNYLSRFAGFGAFGVDLFFVISGFLITGILLKTKNDKDYFKNFYIRRILRIFPLYYGFLIVFIFIIPYLFPMSKFYNYPLLQQNQLWYWLYIPNIFFSFHPEKTVFFHFWSLAIEEQYYMVWPVFVWIFVPKNLKKILLLVILLSFTLRCYFLFFYKIHFNFFFIWSFTPIRLEAISIGSLVSIIYNETGGSILNKATSNRIMLFLVAMIIALCIRDKGFSVYTSPVQSVGTLLMDIFFGFIVFRWVTVQEFKETYLNIFFKKLGKYSYAIYMFHELILNQVALKMKSLNLQYHWNLNNTLTILIIVFITLLLAYILALATWNFYEKWFIKLKRKFIMQENIIL
jgi:peptidoglycan/LPS O-acetylase OafA/YrhL